MYGARCIGGKYVRLGMPSEASASTTASRSTSGAERHHVDEPAHRDVSRTTVFGATRSSRGAPCTPRDVRPLLQEGEEAADLRDPQRGGQLVHPVVESEALVLEPRAHLAAALVAEAPTGGGELVIVRDDHAAFTGGDLLVRVEGEAAGGAEAADGAPRYVAPIASQQSSITCEAVGGPGDRRVSAG